jgi:hypothetical protein
MRTALALALLCWPLAGAAESDGNHFDGTWRAVIDSPRGVLQVIYSIDVADNGAVNGTLENSRGAHRALEELAIEGDTITFRDPLELFGDVFPVRYRGKLEGDRITFVRHAPESGSGLRSRIILSTMKRVFQAPVVALRD